MTRRFVLAAIAEQADHMGQGMGWKNNIQGKGSNIND
jgi:hypothetical protein